MLETNYISANAPSALDASAAVVPLDDDPGLYYSASLK